ncbi:MAG: Holliday junction branch migration protein RuvA [candidate division WOR-3 bacterium]|nr:Holliday junction branch migration protein RuvA [candidate division WOR-3 bacterium]
MIGRLRGKVLEKNPPYLLLDVSGIGFLIQLPLNTFDLLELNQEIVLYTKSLIKEEEIFLFGFLNKTELELFEAMISIPGLGPKSALTLLSNFSAEEITRAIEEENLELLSSVPRIGRKLASKIILEMKGKLNFERATGVFEQAINALCALGLNRSEAISRLKGLPGDLSAEELIKRALKGK